ncbi:MAG: LysM peptidoglycan-binding domain-containing protein [Phycisphaerae bacterium]|jgi:nucleoid-associated protein YgaU
MARETKVGLLAGLAFIICFAIILANGGRQKAQTTPWQQLVDGSANLHRTTPEPGATADLDPQAGVQPRRSDGRPLPANVARSEWTPVRVDRRERSEPEPGLPGSGAEVVLPTRPLRSSPTDEAHRPRGDEDGGATPTEAAQTAPPPARADDNGQTTPIREGRTEVADLEARRRALEDLLEARTAEPSRDAERAGSLHRSPADPRSRSVTTFRSPSVPPENRSRTMPERRAQTAQRYEVQPGDTLSRIAFTHYGTRSAEVVDAIFRANTSTLSSPDLITVGMELVLPQVEGFSGPHGANRRQPPPEPPARQRANPITQADNDFRWYQVKRDDRYVSIAREQLGDAKRWREIFELNKDKFPNPDRIRHGVRIKLPAGEAAPSGAGR